MKIIKGFYRGRYQKMKTLETTDILENTKIAEQNSESEWTKLCNECYSAAKKNNWTKEDSRELLSKVRKELKEIEAY